MRRRLLFLALVSAVSLAAAPAASPATTPMSAKFQLFFGLSTPHPCPAPAYVCGVGAIEGFGNATTAFVIESFSGFDETGCGTTTATETLTLADGSGTLTLSETGTVCAPSGAAAVAPGTAHSSGNPYRISVDYTITSGAGVFAGASGTGSASLRVAGESGHKTVSGSLTLP